MATVTKYLTIRGKTYTLQVDERDELEFDRAKMENPIDALNLWKRRKARRDFERQQELQRPKPKERSLFDSQLNAALLEMEYVFKAQSPYPEHPDWAKLKGNWDFHFEDYPRLGVSGDLSKLVRAYRRDKLVGEWDGLWARFGPGLVEPIAGPIEGDTVLPKEWVYVITDVATVRNLQMASKPFTRYTERAEQGHGSEEQERR